MWKQEITPILLLIFIAIWGASDRFRELPLFWRLVTWIKNKWFLRYNTKEHKNDFIAFILNPFEDGYHGFKILPVIIFSLGMWIYYDWLYALFVMVIWFIAQTLAKSFIIKGKESITKESVKYSVSGTEEAIVGGILILLTANFIAMAIIGMTGLFQESNAFFVITPYEIYLIITLISIPLALLIVLLINRYDNR